MNLDRNVCDRIIIDAKDTLSMYYFLCALCLEMKIVVTM